MIIRKAEFSTSNTDYKNCPSDKKPEYAFIGRSNVGKSSLINMITSNAKLAKISAKPGKTQLINHFLINEHWYLVDLPGYGWAKTSKDNRLKWDKMVKDYFLYRETLACLFVLIDTRLEPQKLDLEFMEWLGNNGIPFVMVFTKADKLSLAKLNLALQKYQETMLSYWEEMPKFFVTSSTTSQGKEEIIGYIDQINKNLKEL